MAQLGKMPTPGLISSTYCLARMRFPWNQGLDWGKKKGQREEAPEEGVVQRCWVSTERKQRMPTGEMLYSCMDIRLFFICI